MPVQITSIQLRDKRGEFQDVEVRTTTPESPREGLVVITGPKEFWLRGQLLMVLGGGQYETVDGAVLMDPDDLEYGGTVTAQDAEETNKRTLVITIDVGSCHRDRVGIDFYEKALIKEFEEQFIRVNKERDSSGGYFDKGFSGIALLNAESALDRDELDIIAKRVLRVYLACKVAKI